MEFTIILIGSKTVKVNADSPEDALKVIGSIYHGWIIQGKLLKERKEGKKEIQTLKKVVDI